MTASCVASARRCTRWPHRRPGPAGTSQELDGLVDTAACREAAVLVPLVPREAGLQVLLTRRDDGLRNHAGQVSFPGGRIDPGDRDAVARGAARNAPRRSAFRATSSRRWAIWTPWPPSPASACCRWWRCSTPASWPCPIPRKSPRCSRCRWTTCSMRAIVRPGGSCTAGARASSGSTVIPTSASGARPPRCCSTCTTDWRASR